MSSKQCFGGGGSSSGANVNLSSTPQTSHRYLTFTLRSSPGSGGSTGGRDNARSIPIPVFQITTAINRPASTHSTLPTDTATITALTLPIIPNPCGGRPGVDLDARLTPSTCAFPSTASAYTGRSAA